MQDTEIKLEVFERLIQRLLRKVRALEKRLAMFNEHETETHLREQLKYASSIHSKFALLYSKVTVLESVNYYLAGDERQFICIKNIIKCFDEEKRFWTPITELTLEELAQLFYEMG